MITCPIAASTPYDVLIGAGLLSRAGELIKEALPARRVVVVTDSHVAPLYLEELLYSLREAGIACDSCTIPAGEASKNWRQLGELLESLAQSGLSRSDALIALGGGVVGDLTGLAASLYQRGIPYVQIPTTLLAAVDSSVGGKTAVDLEAGKNQAGTFWQPALVLCDTDTLRSLPVTVWADGAAESLKYGAIASRELFDNIAKGGLKTAPDKHIAACISMKGQFVAEDEKDTGARQYLNLGHTFGHAIEAQSHFTLRHGQAVAIGMAIAARAAHLAYPDSNCIREMDAALNALGLPRTAPYPADQLLPWLTADKKRRGDRITLVLPRQIGRSELLTLSLTEAKDLFARALSL
ncbi:MAG: 3-dehydroquinate synthase [Lachnospiraceae bacterium]|nr:3-dehydroquinate synthase [Lachnospiraceae bacterium]